MTLAELTKNQMVGQETDVESTGGHFVFEDVTWAYYKQTCEQLLRGGQRARVTFDEGRMEIMTTSGWHEGIKTCVGRLLEHYSFVRDVYLQGFGSLTCDRDDLLKGLQPDECYYIENKFVLDDSGHLDLSHGPPPDLVVEVEVTTSTIPKLPIYLKLRVPEVWRFSSEKINVLTLENDRYTPAVTSRYFPDLDLVEFFRFVQIGRLDQLQGVKVFDAWLRSAGAKK